MKKSLIITCVALLAVGACVTAVSDSDDKSKEQSKENATTEAVAEDTNKSAWQYSDEVDEMTDKTCYFASVVSENSVDFDFPYNGGSTLTFVIRDSPQYGKDAFIKISKGQFNVGVYGEKIKIRLDSDPAFTVNCASASDGSHDILFINNNKSLVAKIKKAKTMKISAEFYNEGNRTFTFNVANLEWDH